MPSLQQMHRALSPCTVAFHCSRATHYIIYSAFSQSKRSPAYFTRYKHLFATKLQLLVHTQYKKTKKIASPTHFVPNIMYLCYFRAPFQRFFMFQNILSIALSSITAYTTCPSGVRAGLEVSNKSVRSWSISLRERACPYTIADFFAMVRAMAF